MGHVGYSTIVIVIIINKALFSVFYRYFLNRPTYDRDRPQSIYVTLFWTNFDPLDPLCHKLLHLLGPSSPSSVTQAYFMDGSIITRTRVPLRIELHFEPHFCHDFGYRPTYRRQSRRSPIC